MGPAKLPYRVIWFVPTRAHWDQEALADFEKLGITAAVWKGRDYTDPKDPNAERMCLDIDAVADAVTIGLDVEKYVCGDPKTDQVCPYHGECKFQAQKAAVKRAEVVIAAHQSLFGTLAKVITDNVGIVVIDKSWWKAGLHTARDTFIAGFADAITKYPPLRDANAVAGKRQKNAPKVMVTDNKATQQLFELSTKAQDAFLETDVDALVSKAHVAATGLTAENCREAAKLEWHRKVEPNIWSGMPRKMRKDALQAAAVNGSIPRRAGIWHALAELLEGTETHTGRLQIGERTDAAGPEPTILLHSRREISNQLKDLPMLLLDASLPEQIIKHFLPRFTTVARIDAAAPFMTVTQVIRGWGRTNMVPTHSSKVTPEENRRRENFLAELRDFVALHKTNRGALVITYQAIEHHFANIPGVATGHFNALRGIDAHGDVGAIFVIGRPLPDFNELRTMAMALTGLPIPIEEPHKETRGLVMADASSTIEVRTYHNQNLELLRSAITDAEVIDNVGRARAVNRTSTDDGVSVYLMADVVTPLPINTLTNWINLRLSPVARMAARGCVLQCSVDAHKAYPDLFASANAAKQAIHTEKARWVSSPYDELYIRETNPPLQLTPVRYQLAGPGKKPSTAWFTSEMVANGRAWLEQRTRRPHALEPTGNTTTGRHDDHDTKRQRTIRRSRHRSRQRLSNRRRQRTSRHNRSIRYPPRSRVHHHLRRWPSHIQAAPQARKGGPRRQWPAGTRLRRHGLRANRHRGDRRLADDAPNAHQPTASAATLTAAPIRSTAPSSCSLTFKRLRDTNRDTAADSTQRDRAAAVIR